MTGMVMEATKPVWRTSLDEPDDYQSDSLSEVESGRENDDVQQDKSYHIGVMMTADEGKAFFGKCYNCGEPGHRGMTVRSH